MCVCVRQLREKEKGRWGDNVFPFYKYSLPVGEHDNMSKSKGKKKICIYYEI